MGFGVWLGGTLITRSPFAVEEYDPSQPDVTLAPAEEKEPSFDPIVSAYSHADSKTLNAEDAPGMMQSRSLKRRPLPRTPSPLSCTRLTV